MEDVRQELQRFEASMTSTCEKRAKAIEALEALRDAQLTEQACEISVRNQMNVGAGQFQIPCSLFTTSDHDQDMKLRELVQETLGQGSRSQILALEEGTLSDAVHI